MPGHNEVAGRATTRIVLHQHGRLVRDALAHWLAALPGCIVVGVADSGPDLVRLCAANHPDVALFDVGAAEPDMVDTIERLSALSGEGGPPGRNGGAGGRTNGAGNGGAASDGRTGPYLIGLHGTLDVAAVLRLHRAGVHRLVGYRAGLAGLRAALHDAEPAHRATARARGLTERELEVLALICAGCSAAQIASALEISPHTVVNHTRHIFAKLDVRSRTQAAAEAARLGLLGDTPIGQPGSDVVLGRAGAVRDEVRRIVATDPGAIDPEAVRPALLALVDPAAEDWSTVHRQVGTIIVVLSGSEDTEPANGADTPDGPEDRARVATAVARGADAVLTGEGLAEHLPAALDMVRAGYLVAPAGPVRALLAAAYPRLAPLALTRRELDILRSIRQGHSVRQTAQTLGIAVKTVQSVQRQLFCRLGARNRTEALALADGLGLADSVVGSVVTTVPAGEPESGES